MSNGASLIAGVISLGLTVWFVVFTVLVVLKLSKIAKLLDKK
jgi:tryptophan-rich sensory protein